MSSQIEQTYKWYPATKEQQNQMAAIRDKAKELALLINESCPDSREKSAAFTNLETVVFWTNAGIVRNS